MTGAKLAAICAAWLCIGTVTAQAAPDEATDEKAAACLSSPKGTPPAGEKWFYRVERGTKRHCWYTRAAGTRRIAEPAAEAQPAKPAPPPPKPVAAATQPATPAPLDHSVANARAEANISGTAAIAPPQPEREVTPPNWQLAERWSDHQNGGAPFESKPAAAPMPIAPPANEAQPPAADSEEIGLQRLLEIAGGAFGFAALATVLVMIFARRQQRRESASTFALFQTTNDPKRKFAQRPADHLAQTIRPRLAQDDEVPSRHKEEDEDEDEDVLRSFKPRNLRAT